MTDVVETHAAQLLETWLAEGHLASQYSERKEARLIERDRDQRKRDFAASIEPVARGMLAMARIDTQGDYTHVVPVTKQMRFPRCSNITDPSTMVVMFNRRAVEDHPADSNTFDPYGRLGLTAVTLQMGNDRRSGGTTAQLGLVLPERNFDPTKAASEDTFAVATIKLDGFTSGERRGPTFARDGLVRYSLGLLEMSEAVDCWGADGSLDYALGFPGAIDYLADTLPKLGKYFTALARVLGSE